MVAMHKGLLKLAISTVVFITINIPTYVAYYAININCIVLYLAIHVCNYFIPSSSNI